MALKHLIQNKLLQYIRESQTFRTVSYAKNTGYAEISDPPAKLGAEVLASCRVNETNSFFELDPRHGRDRKLRRSTWTFQLRAVFNQEVTVEDFEQAWLESPPVLSRQDTSSKQVTLLLVSSDIRHPPQQSSSTGTVAIFTIQAELSRS